MSRYTKVNLKDAVDDLAVGFGLSPNIEFRMGGPAVESEQSGISYMRLAPNFRQPGGHKHKQQEEVYVLVNGSARIKLDDDVHELRPWDAVRIEAGTMRGVEAGPNGAEFPLFGAPKTGPGDAETGLVDGLRLAPPAGIRLSRERSAKVAQQIK
jgi:quercetin dioxygenase-like cupin family protein